MPSDFISDGNATDTVDARSRAEITFSSVFLTLIIIVTIAGNTLVILAIVKSYKLREQVSTEFIINLSITDFSSALMVMLSALVSLIFDLRDVNSVWCRMSCAANYCFMTVSMSTLACISIERYVAVLHPLRHSTLMTQGRVRAMIVFTWLQGVATACPPVILHWISYDYWEAICAIEWHQQYTVYYVIAACTLCFLVPLTVVLICYLAIIWEVKKNMAITHPTPPTCTNSFPAVLPTYVYDKAFTEQEQKTVRSLLVLVVAFLICMTPFCITKLLKVIQSDSVPPFANLASAYFAYLASAINPFIYAIFRADFRKEYNKMANSWTSDIQTLFYLVPSMRRHKTRPNR